MKTLNPLQRLRTGLSALLASIGDAEVEDVATAVEKAVPMTPGEIGPTLPLWEWLAPRWDRNAALVAEPRWAGDRYLHEADDGTLVDVVKTAAGRHMVVDCLRHKDVGVDTWGVTQRRYAAAKFVKARWEAGEKDWDLSPARLVTSRIELAKAFAWASREPESDGLVVKITGPYVPGVSERWVELRDGVTKSQPTAADVHQDAAAKATQKPTYEEESAVIKTNQVKPEAQGPHPFQPAEWTHKNGHPRCLLCGDEESVSKQCAGMSARVRKQKPGAMLVVKVDVKKRIMLGIVHQPGVEDLQGDVITEGDLEKACYEFLKNYRVGKSGLRLDHKRDLSRDEAQLIENYCAPVDFWIPQPDGGREHVLKGSWLQGWELSPSLWEKVEKGEYTGFSMGGEGTRQEVHDFAKEADDPGITGPQNHINLTVNVQPAGAATVSRDKAGVLHVKPAPQEVTTELTEGGK